MKIDGEIIRLDLLDQDGKTAGWVVRRACNVFQAYRPPAFRPDGDGVVDLLRDGRLVGQAATADDARELLVEAVGAEIFERLDDGVVRVSFCRPVIARA